MGVQAALFLQFALPLGLGLWLLWRFVAVPLVKKAQEKIAEEDRSEAIQRAIRQKMEEKAMAPPTPAELSHKELLAAVDEMLEEKPSPRASSQEKIP